MFEWHNTRYMGGAHGLAGILETLLLCRDKWQVCDVQRWACMC